MGKSVLRRIPEYKVPFRICVSDEEFDVSFQGMVMILWNREEQRSVFSGKIPEEHLSGKGDKNRFGRFEKNACFFGKFFV